MPANVYTTTQVVGNREDLINRIFRTSPTDTPFISRIDRVDAEAVWHEWQRDALRAPNPNNAAPEGADASFVLQTPTQRLGNRCQIFTDTFSISGTQNAVNHAGGPEVNRLKAKKAIEQKKDVEASCIVNPIQQIEAGAGVNRMLRGLNGWIATNNDMGVGGVAPDPINNVGPVAGTARAFAETSLKNAILQAYNNGGDVKFCIMAPHTKQEASAFTGNVIRYQDVDSGKTTLNTAYTFYGSDFGNIEMVPDRVMANGLDNNVYGIDPDYWALATLRGFETDMLAKTGDNTSYEMVTELTLEAREERSSFAVRDLE